jgi:hypothetical protein
VAHLERSAKMKRLASVVFLLCELAVARADSTATAIRILRFPDVALKKEVGERIQSFEVVLSCASFHRIDKIPEDWSVVVSSPVSAVSRCRGESGHGASYLWSIRDLDGVVVVRLKREDRECFDVSATVHTTARQLSFSKAELILEEEPNQ